MTFRYASVSKKLDKEGDRQADNNAKERITSSSPMPTDRGDMTSPPKLNLHGCEDKDEEQPVDFVKLNKQRTSIAAKMAAQLNNGVLPSSYKKGVVPKYEVKSNSSTSFSFSFNTLFIIIFFLALAVISSIIISLFFFNLKEITQSFYVTYMKIY